MSWFLKFLKTYDLLSVFVISSSLYGVSAGLQITEQSHTPQYVYLAYSFLHGRLDLITLPSRIFDLIQFRDKWYVPGGMTAALLLMPVVAVLGLSTSDVFFGVLVGATNVTLIYSLLGILTEKASTRIWLTCLFAAGTVHWWLASVGSVWFNAQLVAVLFSILFVRATLQEKSWLAGLWLGLAALSRPPLFFAAAFYLVYVILNEPVRSSAFRKLVPFGIMMSCAVAIMLGYNYFRFGNPIEFGYGYVLGTGALTNTYQTSGGFNLKYIPCNMFVSLLGLPNLGWSPLPGVNEACPYLEPVTHVFGNVSTFFNPLGMSIFLTTPAFLLIFRAKLRHDLVIPAWAGVIGVLIPLWMYHTTGWVQFGYRYSTDILPFLFILLSRAIKRIGFFEMILTGASVIMGGIGMYLMYFMTFELVWSDMFVDLARMVYHFLF